MDPNATLAQIGHLLDAADTEERNELCEDLFEWIERGGFAPDWSAHTEAAHAYRQWLRTAHPEMEPLGAAVFE